MLREDVFAEAYIQQKPHATNPGEPAKLTCSLVSITECDDSMDGGGRAMSGTIAEAQNAVNIGNIDQFCALRESVRFTEEVLLGCALRESVRFTEEVPLGCNDAVGADFKKS
jgi:hypothetical protein